jgi:RNA polymerase primary sigma factor
MNARISRRESNSHSPLQIYLHDINNTALLTAQDERDLAARVAEGDPYARDHMVKANLRLVVNIARGYLGKGLCLEDLIEEGNLGLMRAVEGYDGTMETRFSTYASYWIKQSIKRALVNTAKPIRIPAYMVELLCKWRRMAADLQDSLGRPATIEEIARALEVPKKKLAIVKKAIKVYNLVPQTDQPENGWSLGEMLMDERTKAPDVEMVEADNLKLVLHRLDEMDKREAAVLRMRFGLNDAPPKTLKEIGESLGLTRERVRQIENEALGKLSATFLAD